jgi:hypothetical protein
VFKSGVAPFWNLSPSPFKKRDTGEELKISEASRYTYKAYKRDAVPRYTYRVYKRDAVPRYTHRAYKRDEVPLSQTLPLPLFKGKRDKGGWGYQIKA